MEKTDIYKIIGVVFISTGGIIFGALSLSLASFLLNIGMLIIGFLLIMGTGPKDLNNK